MLFITYSKLIYIIKEMKRLVFLLFFVAITHLGHTQSFNRYKYEAPWSVSTSAGLTQYFGELYSLWQYNEGIQPDWNVNIAVRRTIGNYIRMRVEGTYYQISGQDPPADPRSNRSPRNLHFRSRNWEASAIGEFHLKPVRHYVLDRHFINFYGFAGIGVSTNDPMAQLRGEWVPLRPLQIEENPYSRLIMVFPTGVGMKYKMSAGVDLILELNYRWTLTDYLDDISAFDISDFYMSLIRDYGVNGDGPNPDRLRLAVRNPRYIRENGEPDVARIEASEGRIRRGSGLDNRFDGFLSFNLGLEIYLSRGIYKNDKINKSNKFIFW
ncbi:MAG: hypothetical protein ACXIUQ_17185 [Cecembia sp.]